MTSSIFRVSRELASGGAAHKHAVRVVSTSNITLSGAQTIDGVAGAVGDRVLVVGQTNAAQNGIYNMRASAWVRSDDADQPHEIVLGMTVRVLEGTAYAGSTWALTSPTTGTVSLGVTSLTFEAVDGTPSSESFSVPLTIDADASITATGDNTEPLIISRASSGHRDGFQKSILITRNTWTGLVISPQFHPAGDGTISSDGEVTDYDTTRDYLLVIGSEGGRQVAVLRKLLLVDSTAPTVVSATVTFANPNALVVVFSRSMDLLGVLTGLSLVFDAGTARTITAIEAISADAKTWTLTLSGNVVGSDVIRFIVSATRVAQDLNGNLLATGSTNVTVSGFGLAQWGFTHEWRADMGVTGDPVSAIEDQIGSFNLSQATGSAQPDLDTGGLVGDGVDDIISANTGSGTNPADITSCTLVVHIDTTGAGGAGVHTAIGFGNQADTGSLQLGYYPTGGQAFVRHTNDAGGTAQDLQTAANGRMTLIAQRSGNQLRLSVNGGNFAAAVADAGGTIDTTQLYVSLLACINIGNFADLKLFHAGLRTGTISNADCAAIHTFMLAAHP
jgi:hypothetical protein